MARKLKSKERERFLVGVSRIVVEMSGMDTAKEKRSVVSTLRDRVTARYNVSFAEVGPQDVYDEAIIGLAAVSGSRDYLQSMLDKIPDFIDGLGVCRVLSDDIDIQHY